VISMHSETISICLPKGDALPPLSNLLNRVGFPVEGYQADNRTYRPIVTDLPVRVKIMAEKDVAIQVAVGNYDIGFCGFDWIQEHLIKYRAASLHVHKHLGLKITSIYACVGMGGQYQTMEDIKSATGFISIISEYPNLAENFAITNRLKKFKIFSAWGSVEAYPPEHADVVILSASDEHELTQKGLLVISQEMTSDLCLLVNRSRFVQKNMTQIFSYFSKSEITHDLS